MPASITQMAYIPVKFSAGNLLSCVFSFIPYRKQLLFVGLTYVV
jgi:hypothetical protein